MSKPPRLFQKRARPVSIPASPRLVCVGVSHDTDAIFTPTTGALIMIQLALPEATSQDRELTLAAIPGIFDEHHMPGCQCELCIMQVGATVELRWLVLDRLLEAERQCDGL